MWRYICTSQSQNILSITQREPVRIIVLTAISCVCCKQKGSLFRQLPYRTTVEGGPIHMIVLAGTEGEPIYIIVLIAVSCVPCRVAEGEPIHITVLTSKEFCPCSKEFCPFHITVVTAKSCAPLQSGSRMGAYSPDYHNSKELCHLQNNNRRGSYSLIVLTAKSCVPLHNSNRAGAYSHN